MKPLQARGKTSGWAAFGLQQRQKQRLGSETEEDPFPPITTPQSPLQPCRTNNGFNDFPRKPFSSTLRPSGDFPVLANKTDSKSQLHVGDSSKSHSQLSKTSLEARNAIRFEKLKEVHKWADDGLIKDIMGAVDNDIDKASNLLEGMASNSMFRAVEGQHNAYGHSPNDAARKDVYFAPRRNAFLNEPSNTGDYKSFVDESAFAGKDASNDSAEDKLTLGGQKSVPLEPEWEEDNDVYAIHRKAAIRMMRSASHHSRTAQNAFLRGDHLSAQHFSLKAREEWSAAEKLNAEAAKEILHIRNCENDPCKLDLHGLHATEATQALREHLQKIETQISVNQLVFPNGSNKLYQKNGVVPSLESLNGAVAPNLDRPQAPRQRPLALQVITGIGNHSKGQAALPIAIRSFLCENGYHFDELRPGVITVRPKFRRR